jgi:hypothetical protein
LPSAATLCGDAKDALARELPEAAHCRAALRDALLFFGTPAAGVVFRTQRAAVARLGWSLLEDRKARPVAKHTGSRLYRRPVYEIDVGPRLPPPRPTARCDRRMMLRGAFLACASLAVPARGYHLEFVPPSDAALRRLETLLYGEGLHPKTARRRGKAILYFKGIDAIALLLASIGASSALLQLEDLRALKETKNRIRRLVNMEAANVDRAARAAAVQRDRIAHVAEAGGLRKLPPALREIAELRLGHPTETLAELGRRCHPPVNKSTVNGRIAALLRMAAHLERRAGGDKPHSGGSP